MKIIKYLAVFSIIVAIILGISKCASNRNDSYSFTYVDVNNEETSRRTYKDTTYLSGDILDVFGYNFLGIYDEKNGAGKQYVDSLRKLTVDPSEFKGKTLYGYYEAKTYDVTLIDEEHNTTQYLNNVTYNSSIEQIYVPDPVEGKTFVGWKNDNGTATNSNGIPNEEHKKLNEKYFVDGQAVLYASWTAQECTVSFVDRIKGEVKTKQIEYGNIMKLPTPEDYNNYEFVGWTYSEDETDKAYINNPLIKGNVTLYAKYVYYKEVSIYSNKKLVKTLKLYDNGKYISISINDLPQVDGYSINGIKGTNTDWSYNYSSNCYYIYYNTLDTSYDIVYEPISYKLKYAANATYNVYNQYVGSYTIEDDVDLGYARRENYEFLGWCTDEKLTTTPIKTSGKMLFGNVTLYAKFKGEDREITYDAGDGQVYGTVKTVEYGANYTLPVPTLSGKGFNGWYYLKDNEKVFITDKNGKSLNIYKFDDDISVIADYKTKYFINGTTNNKNYGYLKFDDYYFTGEEALISVVVSKGYKVVSVLIDNVEKEIKSSYTITIGEQDVNIAITLEPIEYNVTFEVGDGQISNYDEHTYNINTTYDLPTAKKIGYIFKGWKIENDDTLYKDKFLYTFDKDIKFVAQYTKDEKFKATYITNEDGLKKISADVSAYYILSNDITLTNYTTLDVEFKGTFNGGNHTIKGLTCPLFSTISGSVLNLTVEGNIIEATNKGQTGLISKLVTGNASLDNVTANGIIDISVPCDAGGLVGYSNSDKVEIINCTNNVNITSRATTYSTGGILGSGKYNKIKNCTNKGTISGGNNTGGILGYSVNGEVINCYNKGEITSSNKICGGLVGTVEKNSTVYITKCYSYGLTNGNKYVGSSQGTAIYNLDQIKISTVEDLLGMSNNESMESYILSADLDFTNVTWVPFNLNATLDGANHTIKNITYKNSEETLGLFTTLSGTLTNLNFENINMTSDASLSKRTTSAIICSNLTGTIKNVNINSGTLKVKYGITGAFAGNMSNGNIENCVNKADVTVEKSSDTPSMVGGFVGYYSSGTLSNLTNEGSVTGKIYTGGIVGLFETKLTSGIGDLVNKGTITGGDYTGGIIGSIITNDYNEISNILDLGDVSGSTYVGGLFGYVENISLTSSYVGSLEDEKQVTIKGDSNVGGVIGKIYAKTTKHLLESHAYVSVTAKYTVGGFVGSAENVEINTCSNENSVVEATKFLNENNFYYGYVGGFAGRAYNLISLTNEATIRYSEKGNYVGGIAGYSDGKVTGCTTSKDISATDSSYVGGLVGYIDHKGKNTLYEFDENTNEKTVSGKDYVGGLFGYIYNNNTNGYSLAFNNINITSNVTGNSYVGGLVGKAEGTLIKLIECTYNGTINAKGGDETTYKGGYAGGFAGQISASNTESCVSNCEAKATINAGFIIGAIAGELDNVRIIESQNTGSSLNANFYVVDDNSDRVYLGGFVGKGFSISNSTNAIDITYDGLNGQDRRYIGGLAGYLTNTITECVNNGNITAKNSSMVGGIVGCLNPNAKNGTFNLSNNINNGAVTGKDRVGGIIGELYNDVTGNDYDTNYYITINFTDNTNSTDASITGDIQVGGLIGYAKNTVKNTWIDRYPWPDRFYEGNIKILSCTNEATFKSSDYKTTGGIVGEMHVNGKSSEISDCINHGLPQTDTICDNEGIYGTKDDSITLKNNTDKQITSD